MPETGTCLYCGHAMHADAACEAVRMIGVPVGPADFYKGNRGESAVRDFTSVGGVALKCQCVPQNWNWEL